MEKFERAVLQGQSCSLAVERLRESRAGPSTWASLARNSAAKTNLKLALGAVGMGAVFSKMAAESKLFRVSCSRQTKMAACLEDKPAKWKQELVSLAPRSDRCRSKQMLESISACAGVLLVCSVVRGGRGR